MHMPLVSKFLCYLEAVARRGNWWEPPSMPSFIRWRLERSGIKSGNKFCLKSSWRGPLVIVIVSAVSSCHCPPSSTRRTKKIPKPTLKASLLVPTGSGEGLESLLEHDSKAHPPFVCPRSLAYMHIQLLEVQAKHDDAYASGFKVSLLFSLLCFACVKTRHKQWCCLRYNIIQYQVLVSWEKGKIFTYQLQIVKYHIWDLFLWKYHTYDFLLNSLTWKIVTYPLHFTCGEVSI
jgi:hypothetical protein